MDDIDLYTNSGDWRQRLDYIVQTMREVSRHTDPQSMVEAYGRRMRRALPSERFLSLTRRGAAPPEVIIARDLHGRQTMDHSGDVWGQRNALPRVHGGILSDLVYSNEFHYITDLDLNPDDPAREYLEGFRSLVAIPVYEDGEAINVIVLLRREPDAFDPQAFPQIVWTSNLFGRATHNLVLRREVQEAYDLVDREMRIIGDIQRALLPEELPEIETLDLAAYYEPARRAGGDYYDFFALEDGRLGIFLADASGHGSPAAVHMAITHTLAHTRPADAVEPADVLAFINHYLARHYSLDGAFVTAFFGTYDPATLTLRYSSAGHPPPRVKRCADDSLFSIDQARGIPLGVLVEQDYHEAEITFSPGDQIIFYTDGLTESFNPNGEMFGPERLDRCISDCQLTAQGLVDTVLQQRDQFAEGREPHDDITVLVARVRAG